MIAFPDNPYLWTVFLSFATAILASVIAGSPQRLRVAVKRWAASAIGAPRTLRGWVSLLFHMTVERHDKSLRKAFETLELPEFKASQTHPHGELAAKRAAFRESVRAYAIDQGYEPVFLIAASEEHGQREFYWWAEDLGVELRQFECANPMYIIVDAEFYLSKPEVEKLLASGQPVVLMTIQPEMPSGTTDEAIWTFDAENNFCMEVRGGGRYRHGLFDWSTDTVSVLSSHGSWFCCFSVPVFATYQIQVRRATPVGVIVQLTPKSRLVGPQAWLARLFLKANYLRQFRPVTDDFIAVRRMTENEPVVDVSLVNSYITATVPLPVWSALKVHTVETTYPMSLSILKSMLKKFSVTVDSAQLPTLLAALKRIGKVEEHVPFAPGVNTYSTRVQHEPRAATVTVQSRPLIAGACWLPMPGGTTLKAGVVTRIINLQTEDKFEEYSPGLASLMREFAEHLADLLGEEIEPVDVEEVLAAQKRPSQLLNLRSAIFFEETAERVSCFTKKESYPQPKDPRIISVMTGAMKLEYAKYVYALNRLLHRLSFYAFGRNPEEIAMKVADICARAEEGAVLADISRMDGNVSAKVRAFELYLWRLIVAQRWHRDLTRTVYQNYMTRGLGVCDEGEETFGGTLILYLILFSRTSGSMETAVKNTFSSTAIYYVAKRHEGASKAEAKRWLKRHVITGGDDGLATDLQPAALIEAGRMLGFTLTVDYVPRGGYGVNFLARTYTTMVWDGDHGSWMDIKRSLNKYHVTMGKLTVLEWAYSRYIAYSRSDAHTPVVDVLTSLLQRYVTLQGRKVTRTETSWWTNQGEGNYDWPQTEACRHEADLHLEHNLEEFDVNLFLQWANDCAACPDETFAENFLNPPVCWDVETSESKYVDVNAQGIVDDPDIEPRLPQVKNASLLFARAKKAVEANLRALRDSPKRTVWVPDLDEKGKEELSDDSANDAG